MFRTELVLQASAAADFWIVREPLIWDAADGRTAIIVPAGFTTDLASVPRLLRGMPHFDVNGRARRPAVLHDFLYFTGMGGKRQADFAFYDALRFEGVSQWNAWLFWKAVDWFGFIAWRGHRKHDSR